MDFTSPLSEAATGGAPAPTTDGAGGTPSGLAEAQTNGGPLAVATKGGPLAVATKLADGLTDVEVEPNGNGTALASKVPTLPRIEIGRRTAWAKRAFDLVVSTILLIVLAPALLLIALAIKIDSPGPVLFRQYRVGRNGNAFGMIKFRTMIRDADVLKNALRHLNEAPDGLFKIAGDPRLTRVGRFLRATSFDELPQLLHVISGRMSLVGPRPLVPEEDALIEAPYRRRLDCPPGMTGPWQAAGASKVPLSEMVELDYEYVASQSLVGDLKLILQTVPHVVRRRGI